MKRLILIMLFLFITPVFAADENQQENVPSFTDQDLEKYRYPSERKGSADAVRLPKDIPGGMKDVEREERHKPKRYEVPYTAYEGTARRIIIPVKFNDSVSAPMILDTGATGDI